MTDRNPLKELGPTLKVSAGKHGASEEEIETLRAFSEIQVPEEYAALATYMTDVEIQIGGTSYIRIWGPVRAREMNEAYAIQKHLPKSLAIGDDEGGSALILMTGSRGFGLYLTGLSELDVDEAQYIAPSLRDFLVCETGIDVVVG